MEQSIYDKLIINRCYSFKWYYFAEM